MPSLRRRLAAGLVLGFLVILALAIIGDLRQVGAHLSRFNWALTPIILACTLFNYSLRFFKWHYYLGRIGIQSLGWRESAHIFVAGFPLAVTPGKAGEALKGVWLKDAAGTPVPQGVTVVLAERVSDGLAVLLLSSLGVAAFPRYWPVFLITMSLLLAVIVVSQIHPLADRLIEIAMRIPILGRLAGPLRDFYRAAQVLFHPRATLIAVGLGTVAWLGEGVAMYLVLRGLGVPGGGATLGTAVFVLSFSTVVGAISALPGGLGAAEASIAAAATLLIRFATLWFGVGLGLAVWAASDQLPFRSTEAAI
jgi:uncharacterized protein (TIRG00374 family)